MLFESIIISQLSNANTRDRVIDRHERGTFLDDLVELVEEVEREDERHKMQERRAKRESTDGLPKYDYPSREWVDVETGEVIEYDQR